MSSKLISVDIVSDDSKQANWLKEYEIRTIKDRQPL